jgi:hypothetical protein
MRDLPASVSPKTIDRILKPVKDKGRLRGPGLTKPGTLLRDQIPVRVMSGWDERKPGFFEFDRVAHCGADASGQFCQTLTATDVGSGWTEEHALLNSAHRWVKERVEQIYGSLPFPLKGTGSDSGGEFISHQLKDWRGQNSIQCAKRVAPAAPAVRTTIASWNRKTAVWCGKPWGITAMKARK